MDHLAILKKSLGLLEKIRKGQKTIESRWYSTRRSPWNQIKEGDEIYFKNSGDAVSVIAKASKIVQYSDLTPEIIYDVLKHHGSSLGLDNIDAFFETIKNKKYCVLVYLDDVREIKPFEIDKSGFGLMSAWITIDDISRLKKDISSLSL